jgi:hypothetical protein
MPNRKSSESRLLRDRTINIKKGFVLWIGLWRSLKPSLNFTELASCIIEYQVRGELCVEKSRV